MVHNHSHNRLIVLSEFTKIDPAGLLSIKYDMSKEIERRFNWIIELINEVFERDILKLNNEEPLISNASNITEEAIKKLQEQAFDFNTSEKKVEGFMDWLEDMEDLSILEKTTRSGRITAGTKRPWSDVYVQSSYQKGIFRARREMESAGVDITKLDDDPNREVDILFNRPFHSDRAAYLYTRTFNELKGVTKEMDRQLSNILSQGIVDGKNGKVIAKEITTMIPKIGINRARTIARTEIQRAHHQANINEYMNAQVQGVVVLAEWENGANPCPICSSLSGEVFTLEKIRGLIPQHPNCFIDYQVPIYTSKGWKRIGDIVIGDYVLTHKGRFKKVTRLYKEKGQSPETIKLTFDTGNNKTLTLTSEHPILINGNWLNAKDVKVGDEVQVLAGECKRCGKKTQWDHKYCSRTCLSLDITDKQWSDPKHRKHMSKLNSKRMKQAYADGTIDRYKVTEKANIKCRELVKEGKWILQQEEVREKGRHLTNTPLLRKLSSIRMKEENPMYDSVSRNRAKKSLKKFYKEHPEKKLNTRLAIMRWNGEMNSLEKQMADLLDKIGIKYEYQYKVLNYYIDFAIPELKIAIEVDGNYWHKGNEKQDKKRQTKIEGEGWFVLRYSEDKIKECKKEIKHELKRVLMNHKGEYSFIPLKVIKTETFVPKKKVTLYNFAVDKDESYIAKGFVVHNCVCVAIPFQPGIDSVKGAVPSVAGWLPNCSEVMHDVLPSTLQRMNMYVNAAKSCLTPVDKKKVEKAIKKNPPVDAKTREKLLVGEKILEFTPKNPLFEDQYKKYVKEINTTWLGKDRKYIAKRALQEILADVFGDNKANGRILFGKENDIKSVISFTEQNHFKNKGKYFYIDYVATKEKGYGLKSMMQVATEAEKTGKGIYLQSAKDAIGFYKKLGMFEEIKDDLNYFTFTPSQVKSFVKKFKDI